MRCLIVLTPFALLQVLLTGVQGATVAAGDDCTASSATCEAKSTCDTTARACKWNVGETCVVATPKCGPNAVCDSTTTMCKCSDGFTGTPTCTAIAEGALNGRCRTSGTACDTANATCTSTYCKCSTGFAVSSGACAIQAGYLTGSCSTNADCEAKDPNSQCTTTKCTCKTGYTANGIVCSGAVNVIASFLLILVSVVTSRFL